MSETERWVFGEGRPRSDELLWRYMDLAKFTSLVQTGELYFQRASAFDDKLEGSFPQSMKEDLAQWGSRDARREMRERVYISCWNLSEHESAAMWSLYAPKGGAIAIQTTFGAFCQVLPTKVAIGRIKYLDFGTTDERFQLRVMHAPFFWKRRSFSHEKEFRALIEDLSCRLPDTAKKEKGGIRLPVNLNDLIKCIFIDPTAAPWFEEVVRGICKSHQITAPVLRSTLDAEALF